MLRMLMLMMMMGGGQGALPGFNAAGLGDLGKMFTGGLGGMLPLLLMGGLGGRGGGLGKMLPLMLMGVNPMMALLLGGGTGGGYRRRRRRFGGSAYVRGMLQGHMMSHNGGGH